MSEASSLLGSGVGTVGSIGTLSGTTGATGVTTTTNIQQPNTIPMSYQTSGSSLPDWYTGGAHATTDYYQQALSELPTGGYTDPRVAGLTANQLAGVGQAGGYLSASQPLYGAGAGYQTQGAGLYGTGASIAGQANPYFQSGANLINTGAAQYGAAGNLVTGASQYNPAAMQQHLNPYTTGALNELARLSTEQLNQKTLPEVQSSFVGAGQFGGTRNAEFTQRALANQQRELLGAQAGLLNTAYNNAAEDYRQWGQLGIQGGQALGQFGQGLGVLGSQQGQLGQGVGQLGQTYGQLGQGLGQLGQNLGQYGISGVNTGMSLSALQQAQAQAQLDADRAEWEQGYTFPLAQFGALGQAYNAATGHITPTQSSSNYQF